MTFLAQAGSGLDLLYVHRCEVGRVNFAGWRGLWGAHLTAGSVHSRLDRGGDSLRRSVYGANNNVHKYHTPPHLMMQRPSRTRQAGPQVGEQGEKQPRVRCLIVVHDLPAAAAPPFPQLMVGELAPAVWEKKKPALALTAALEN